MQFLTHTQTLESRLLKNFVLSLGRLTHSSAMAMQQGTEIENLANLHEV